MPEAPIVNQPVNNIPAANAEFENDMRGFYNDAEKQSAIDFALQNQKSTPAPADGIVGAANDIYKKQMDSMGTTDVARAGIGVGQDVGLGIIQSPRHIARGVTKGVNGVVDFIQSVNDMVPTLSFFDSEGKKQLTPDLVLQGENRARINKNLAAQNPASPDQPNADLPHVPVPHDVAIPTITGGAVEAITQFATGLGAIGKATKAMGIAGATTKVGKVAESIGTNAAADLLAFDKQDQRLSNVLESVPALKNPVTEYLAANPHDSAALAKFKQGVEGVLTGAAGELIVKGVGVIKNLRAVKAAADASGQTIDQALRDVPLEEKAGIGLQPKNFEFLGDPTSQDYFIPTPKDKIAQATAEVQGAFGKTKQIADAPAAAIPDYQINFARINGPDDIKQLMDEMVNKPELKPSIDAARRGTQSNAQTLSMAQDINGFDSLMARRTGDAFNAEHITAARQVYYDTTDKLMQAAKAAAAPTASDIDVFNFRKMVAVHHAVQKEFMGVRAEAGRALQAWSIPMGGTPAQQLRLMEQTLNDFGGADVGKELARKLSSVADISTDQINQITRQGALARTGKAVEEAWTLGLLTNPQTHVVNLSSNVLTTLTLGMERMAAAGVKDSPVTVREGLAYWSALLQSQRMAIKNAAQAFRTGESSFGGLKTDMQPVRATARDILDPEGKAGVFSKAMDYYGGALSKYVGGGLLASDEYSKTVLYQAQLRALATREGIAQGLDGAALKQHVADALTNPPDGLAADAESFARYGTFTRELGQQGQAFQRLVARVPMARFAVPFIRTPANIFKFTFERTPLAPLSSKIRDDIAAGGVRRAMAMSRIGMGTTVMSIGSDMALNGQLSGSGPNDPKIRAALKRTGWQPYSIKVGDTWYSYARLEPMATVLGMSADIAEILSNYEAYDVQQQEEADNLVTAAAIAASNQVIGKTFLRGFADLNEAMSDPKRFGEQYFQKTAGSIVPAGVAAVERAVDPASKQVFNMADAMKARIPGFSDKVPPRRNIWGDEINYFTPSPDIFEGGADRVMSLFNPVYSSKETDSPVDKWILHNGFSIDMPDKTQEFDGVKIDLREHPWIYDAMVKERGNGVTLVKYGNQTMKQFFDGLAKADDPMGRHIGFYMAIGHDYQDQQNFISGVVRDYTKAARDKVMHDHVDVLAPEIERGKRQAARLNAVRGPVTQ